MSTIFKLDYSIESPEERNELVKNILKENPNPSEAYLEVLGNYLVLCLEKQEKKEKKILTDNRLVTVNNHETSFEGLVSQLENGEDGIYNLINESKTAIFRPKVTITKKDLDEIPLLKQLRDAINEVEIWFKRSEGKKAFGLKKALIEMRKDQYIIRNSYRCPIVFNKISHSKDFKKLDENFTFNSEGYIVPTGVSLADPAVISAILCNYSKLKEDSYGKFESDLYYLMYDFDILSRKVLDDFPVYKEIVVRKIDGLQNIEIQQILKDKFGITHSLEYISSLWRKKIPNLIASAEEDEILDNYYTIKEKGKFKRCSRCGDIKLAHNKYFSKNKTSKDSFYSICKCCRNKRKEE